MAGGDVLCTLHDGPAPHWPNRPLGAARTFPAKAHPAEQVAAEDVAAFAEAEGDHLDVVGHRLIVALRPPRW